MIIFCCIFSYLMGSIPSGYLLVRYFLNKDVREYGSGNIGATNVCRVGGKKLGNLTQGCDMLKALIPLFLGDMLLKFNLIIIDRPTFLTLIGLCSIIGHNYTIFLKFKGGKGVATTAAAFFYIVPIPTLISGAVFFGLKLFTKIVSIRSLALGIALFVATLALGYDKAYVIGSFIAAIFIIIRHKSNIQRLIKGEEK